MKNGDIVSVYPHGKPELRADAIVQIASETAIAVSFYDKPPFVVCRTGMAVHPKYGCMLFARREILNGKPWGPWIEVFGDGHFEIEEVADGKKADARGGPLL
jgi:hypothetical protein